MQQITRPMKAPHESCKPKLLKYPVVVSPKLDGIRCLVLDHQALTNSFKLQPNRHVQNRVSLLPDGLDGELTIQEADNFSAVESGIMSAKGSPPFVYNVFDCVKDPHEPFMLRFQRAKLWVDNLQKAHPFVQLVPHHLITNCKQLLQLERHYLKLGYEGLMIRDPNGPYKSGRATPKEGWLLKLKRFTDGEARVIGFEERMHNDNEAFEGELGQTKRSSSKEGKIPAGTLGKLVVKDIKSSKVFKIGVFKGLNDAAKFEIWQNQDAYLGRLVKYKYQAHGTKDRPRIPVWAGWRSELDL